MKVLVILISFLTVACGSLKTRRDSVAHKAPLQESTFDQREDPTIEIEPKQMGVPTKVGLILGPGGARTFAHVGVLRELSKQRIQPEHIVGLEWASLVGALYAQKGLVHDLEWKLYKLDPDDLVGRNFFSNRLKPQQISILSSYMKTNLSTDRIESGKLGFSCPIYSMTRGTKHWVQSGGLNPILLRCMAFPPLYEPHGEWVADPFSLKEAVAHLKNKGVNLILFVDVLRGASPVSQEISKSNPAASLLWAQLKKSLMDEAQVRLEVISIDASQFSLSDFKKRQELVRLGESQSRSSIQRVAEKYSF